MEQCLNFIEFIENLVNDFLKNIKPIIKSICDEVDSIVEGVNYEVQKAN